MSVPQRAIQDWVTRRRTTMDDRDALVQRFELWHAVDGEFGEPIGRYELDTRDDDEDPDDLVQEIWNDAVHDTGTRPQGSYQRYVIKAFRRENGEATESKAFSLTGTAGSAMLGGTESPTPRGMMAQEMRQNDNLHGMMIRMAEGSAGQLAQQLRESRENEARLVAERSRLLDIEQRLLDRSHERDMDRQERQKSAERIDMVLGMVTTMLPILVGKLLDGKPSALPSLMGSMLGGMAPPAPPGMGPAPVGAERGATRSARGSSEPHEPAPSEARHPEPASSETQNPPAPLGVDPNRVRHVMARDEGIKNLLGTLNAEQVRGLAQILRPDQAMGFMEVYQDYREEVQGDSSPARESVETPESEPAE